jgi:hypothetical protein
VKVKRYFEYVTFWQVLSRCGPNVLWSINLVSANFQVFACSDIVNVYVDFSVIWRRIEFGMHGHKRDKILPCNIN